MTGNRETRWPQADGRSLEQAYRLWVNDERTVLVRLWKGGDVEVAVRKTPEHTWGPPFYLSEEKFS